MDLIKYGKIPWEWGWGWICLLRSKEMDGIIFGTRCIREMSPQKCTCLTPPSCFRDSGARDTRLQAVENNILLTLFPQLSSLYPLYLPFPVFPGLFKSRDTKQHQDRIQPISHFWASFSTSVKGRVQQDELQVLFLATLRFYDSYPKGTRHHLHAVLHIISMALILCLNIVKYL